MLTMSHLQFLHKNSTEREIFSNKLDQQKKHMTKFINVLKGVAPFSLWLVKRDLPTMVITHSLTWMILQVPDG